MPSRGHVDAVVIPLDFSDVPAQGDARSLGERAVSQLDYFAEVSYGRFSVSATILGRFYRMPRPASAYGSWFDVLGPAREIVADATAAADADVDFSKYQFVYLLMPHFPQSGNPAWSVFPGKGVVRDGTELRHATFLAQTFAEGNEPWVAIHELSHSLGLPDIYYETDPIAHTAAFDAVGIWDPMSSPGPRHFLTWNKWKLGWLDASQIACAPSGGTVTDTVFPLEQQGGLKMVVVQTSASTAYVVEARRPLGRYSNICRAGVLVYTVDSQVDNARGAVKVKPAAPGGSCGLLSAAPFDAGGAYEDAAVKIEVLSARSDGAFDVRVTHR
jgi:M6 family metalloprotease-like protein